MGFRADQAAFILGSCQLFADMVAARWLKPDANCSFRGTCATVWPSFGYDY